MKIPTTPPGGAPYYHGPPVNGMEMNPQWQGNGVVIDGPPPGNGAAYILPHHVHPAGFVPPPGYYGPGASPPAPTAGPAVQQDFSEYMWMENEEEFDKQVMQQLEEEALMEQCIEAMLADEREAQNRIAQEVNLEEQVSKSTLNPLAAEFVPTFSPSLPIPSTSDQDPQPSASVLCANTSKSIESSMSELSISQTSDVPTESSKSSGDVPEELCNLPLDTAIIRSEQEKEEPETAAKSDNIVVVSAVSEEASKSLKSDTESCKVVIKEELSSKKTVETVKSKPDPSKLQKQIQEPKDLKTNKNESATSKNLKSQDIKNDSSTKKTDAVSKTNQSKNSQTAAKGKTSDSKTKENDKPKVSDAATESLTPVVPAPSLPETEKPQPAAAPAVFNYAAAARANLPAKPAQPTPAQSVTPIVSAQQPIVKQDSIPKDPPPSSTQPSSASGNGAKPQTKPGPKQIKPNRDAKEPAKGATPARGNTSGPRKNKK